MQMLDPRWNTFLAVCETMNYTKAAQRLCLTQPAVTHHIQYLEQHYGCRLFTYEGKVLRLTEAGLRLREFTRSMAYNEQKMEQTMAASGEKSLYSGWEHTMGEEVSAGWRNVVLADLTFFINICPALEPVPTWLINSREGMQYSPSTSPCSVISGWGAKRSFWKVTSSW